MKILTPRNNKDYYDYLTGIYGMDSAVVYDRRQFTVLARLDTPFFSKTATDKDTPKEEIRTQKWIGRHWTWVNEYVATTLYCMLEVGLKWYFFEVERYLDNLSNVCLDWKIVRFKEISKSQRLGISPMTFFKAYKIYSLPWLSENIDIRVDKSNAISNPILNGTPITSLIPPNEIYLCLSAYLSSLKDVEFIDSRTYEQKAESAGFDRKSSFRNIK